jgi:hypothetical protein
MAKRLYLVPLALWLTTAANYAQERTPQQPAAPETAAAAPLPTPASVAALAPSPTPAALAPTRVGRGARLFIEPGDFAMPFAAAIMSEKVPVVVVAQPDKADFVVRTVSDEKKAGGGEKIARSLVCWPFCGSGDKFNGTITVTNRDDVIVFAYLARKGNVKKAASDAAKNVRRHIEGKS